ncbi:hypothetical protein [Sphaerisporangium fuscum]|uniref:hypothetical protein n=1 Tax=Sphaerisporangium fuscum TaxID=2835868 RepID=UPI001BDCB0FA|nr:hypothetical protein [Sphaerisporangium fuscum]
MRKATAVILASTITAGLVITGSAVYAAIGGAEAPYARAAAVVKPDGSVVRSKGVVNVRRFQLAHYCVEVDHDIDLTKTVPIATLHTNTNNWSAGLYITPEQPNAWCKAHEIFVYGAGKDIGFDLVVP